MPNALSASILIDQLVQQGVRHFCIAPGSRSAPLAMAIAYHPHAIRYVHFDERALAFYAFGLTQGSRSPVAILVSSGSAVGNLLPAVMEASQSAAPLILITADRPPELRQCGANQTIHQHSLFSPYVEWQFDFPPPDLEVREDFLRSQVAAALFAARKGPVHLNCMFREPLWEGVPTPSPRGQPILLESPELSLRQASHAQWNALLDAKERGIILVGRLHKPSDLTAIMQLAHALQWPICADLLSQCRGNRSCSELISHVHWILPTTSLNPDCILHFGDRFISKLISGAWPKIPYLYINEQTRLHDPLHCQTARLYVEPDSFVRAIHIRKSSTTWLDRWRLLDQIAATSLKEFHAHASWSEASAMHDLGHLLPQGWNLFLGTSMPVREADAFLFPHHPTLFFSNRGVSGIDGTLATALGIARGIGTPLLAFLGDQAMLHDLNSLSLLAQHPTPFILIISNNFGGGIFSHLPIAKENPHFDTLFTATHAWTFRAAAEMFSLPYTQAHNALEFRDAFSCAVRSSKACILELMTSKEENVRFHKKLGSVIHSALSMHDTHV